MNTVPCLHCGLPVDNREDYREFVGWERPRGSKGGTNHAKDKTETGRWLHRTCWLERHAPGAALF